MTAPTDTGNDTIGVSVEDMVAFSESLIAQELDEVGAFMGETILFFDAAGEASEVFVDGKTIAELLDGLVERAADSDSYGTLVFKVYRAGPPL